MTTWLRAAFVVTALLLPGAARAQIETREGIALQNQILQLRGELEALRRGGAGLAPPVSGSLPPPGRGGAAPQGELVGQLLDRVARLEEELRNVRGRAEGSEFRERQLRERVEKLEGDLDFRLRQIEEQRRGDAGSSPRPPVGGGAVTPPAGPQPAVAAVARPPQRALAEGQAALARRDFAAAEIAAREVVASREATRQVDGNLLLGDSLLGQRKFAEAAVAYDDALRRNRQGSRAPEAMLGIANALAGLGNTRDACVQLADLRGSFPNLSGAVAERAAEARRRAGCR